MTILELLSEHLPRDLAGIVTGYAIREDWKPFMDDVVAAFRHIMRRSHYAWSSTANPIQSRTLFALSFMKRGRERK